MALKSDDKAVFVRDLLKKWKKIDDSFLKRTDFTEQDFDKIFDYTEKHFSKHPLNQLKDNEQMFFVAISYFMVVTQNPVVMLNTAKNIALNKKVDEELRQFAGEIYQTWLKASFQKVQ